MVSTKNFTEIFKVSNSLIPGILSLPVLNNLIFISLKVPLNFILRIILKQL